MPVIINNVTRGTVIAHCARVADSFFKRFIGLMGKTSLNEGSGLIIVPCNGVHMFFMKIPLDLVFLDPNNVVLYVVENIKPWSISKIVNGANRVVELPVGSVKKSMTSVGDVVEIF